MAVQIRISDNDGMVAAALARLQKIIGASKPKIAEYAIRRLGLAIESQQDWIDEVGSIAGWGEQ